jgi:hypothetical protein
VSSELVAICSRCNRTLPLVVVDAFDQPLTNEQEAAVRDYAEWYETFDESEDAWIVDLWRLRDRRGAGRLPPRGRRLTARHRPAFWPIGLTY